MAISTTVYNWLQDHHVDYDVLAHSHSSSSMQTAIAAHIPARQLAKAVVLKDPAGHHFMAVVPAANRVRMHELRDMLADDLQLVSEQELSDIFPDCETGAVPALGQPYGIDMIWDDELQQTSDVYLEGGDHEQLIHLDRQVFESLMLESQHGDISEAMTF